jgi:hypothetical protein
MLAALGALSVSGSVAALDVALTTVAVALATFVLASLTDAFGGMLIGLVGAASFTAIHQYLPDARPLSFATQALTLGLLFLLGMSTGLVADRMRRAHRITARGADHAILPVEGSLGLLSSADAAEALTHEKARAELHHRPLTTATITMEITQPGLGPEEARRARRAVARSLETELRVTDLVYVDAEGHFGAILPETTPEGALDVVESALMVARIASFADREVGRRTPVADVAVLAVEITAVVAPTAPSAAASTRRKSRTSTVRTGSRRIAASHEPAPDGTAPTERAEAV